MVTFCLVFEASRIKFFYSTSLFICLLNWALARIPVVPARSQCTMIRNYGSSRSPTQEQQPLASSPARDRASTMTVPQPGQVGESREGPGPEEVMPFVAPPPSYEEAISSTLPRGQQGQGQEVNLCVCVCVFVCTNKLK